MDHSSVEASLPDVRLSTFNAIDKAQLKKILSKMKKTNCSLDPIPISDIFGANNFTLYEDLILNLVNASFASVKFPSLGKLGLVKPTLKGALDVQSLSSYRPVSNLSIVSKVIESAVKDQLSSHLDVVEALPENQSAYRAAHSTETTVCSVVSDALGMLDEKKCGILIMLDLSAAFDTVVHRLLIEDLKLVGVEGDALQYM